MLDRPNESVLMGLLGPPIQPVEDMVIAGIWPIAVELKGGRVRKAWIDNRPKPEAAWQHSFYGDPCLTDMLLGPVLLRMPSGDFYEPLLALYERLRFCYPQPHPVIGHGIRLPRNVRTLPSTITSGHPLMSNEESNRLASEYADRNAPLPKYDPAVAGFVCAGATTAVLTVFAGLAGFELEGLHFALSVTIAISFAVPFTALKLQERRHYKVWNREYERLLNRDTLRETKPSPKLPASH